MHRKLVGFASLILSFTLVATLGAQTPASGQGKTQPATRARRPAAPAPTAGGTLGPAELTRRAEQTLRRLYAWGPEYKLEFGPPAATEIPYFLVVPVAVTRGTQRQQEVVSISTDGKYLLLGQIVNTTSDPFTEAMKRMDLSGRPSKGPSDAAVTVVVFSDFECPHCKELYRTLKGKIEPKFPQVRIVFKNFPLTQIHPWAMVAALAGHCAYEQSPEKFWPLHDLIFENQATITPETARGKLIGFAQQTGLDVVPFNTCLTSDGAWRAVQADVDEAKALQIANTPTVFINGRRYLGSQSEAMQQIIEFELGHARKAGKASGARQN